MLSIAVAHDLNGLIGYNNTIPWHYPQASEEVQASIKRDMQFFRERTLNRSIIMGRTTYQSLPGKLKKRYNIVVSRKMKLDTTEENYTLKSCTSLEEAIELGKAQGPEVVIIGGAQIYQQALPLVDELYISVFQFRFEPGNGNKVYFPALNEKEWNTEILETMPGLVIKKLTKLK